MVSANDAAPVLDVARARAALRTSLEKLMDAQDYLAGQIAILDGIERQVRGLALREGDRSIGEGASPDELSRLGELQAQTNADFRRMHETYAHLSAQITALMERHERLYDATFARGGEGSP